jgi:hypothetical protein
LRAFFFCDEVCDESCDVTDAKLSRSDRWARVD